MINISIITVVLNNSASIKDAIESVLSQTYPSIQYIIIDGGSTDGSLQIIEANSERIKTIISEPDNGIYDAMNKGLALATGDIVGFLNADDFYANEDVIKNVASKFEQENCDVLYADLDYVSRSEKNKVIRKWRSGSFEKARFLKGWMPPHPTFFVKREVYKKLGGYNQALHYSADYELMLRFLFKNTLQVSYLDKVIVKMRVGGQSNRSLKNRLFANLQDRKAWDINGLKPQWFTLILKPLSKIRQYFG